MNWNEETPLLIVSHYFNDKQKNLYTRNWIGKVFVDCPIYLYKKGFDVPVHGNMASTYLKFIFDNYDNLPKSIFFLEGEIETWHHNPYYLFVIPQNLSKDPEMAEKYQYVNVNTTDFDDRILGKNPAMNLLLELWDEHFRSFFKKDCPKYIRDKCCAQFVVQRSAIHKVPKENFEKWYKLSINEKYDSILIDRVFEYIWHMIFGMPDIIKPSEKSKSITEIINIPNKNANETLNLIYDIIKKNRLEMK